MSRIPTRLYSSEAELGTVRERETGQSTGEGLEGPKLRAARPAGDAQLMPRCRATTDE
mgnify:CR=1 FL=1